MYTDIGRKMLLSRQQLPADLASAIPADVAAQLPSSVTPDQASQVAQQVAAVSSNVAAVQSGAAKAVSVAETFSSFDKCMQKNYCKIPFIVGCVVGGLIIFSLLWCCFRCLCCGARCCCCGGGSRKEKTTEIIKEQPIIYTQPSPATAFPPAFRGGAAPQQSGVVGGSAAPQYATFESDSKSNQDALPAMPQWEQAKSERILEEVEMSPVDNSQLKNNAGMNAGMATAGFGGPPRGRNQGGYSPLGSRGGSPEPLNNMGMGPGPQGGYQDNMANMPPNGGYRGTPGPGPRRVGTDPNMGGMGGPGGPMPNRGPGGPPGGFNGPPQGPGYRPAPQGGMGGYGPGPNPQQGLNRQQSFPNQPISRQNTGGPMGGPGMGPGMGMQRQQTFPNNPQGRPMGPGGPMRGPGGPGGPMGPGPMRGSGGPGGPMGPGPMRGPGGPNMNMGMGPNANQRMEFQNDGYGPQDNYGPGPQDPHDNYGPGPVPGNNIGMAVSMPEPNMPSSYPPNRQMSPANPYPPQQGPYNQGPSPQRASIQYAPSNNANRDYDPIDDYDYPADPAYQQPPQTPAALMAGPPPQQGQPRQITPQNNTAPYGPPQRSYTGTPTQRQQWDEPQGLNQPQELDGNAAGRIAPPKEFVAFSPKSDAGGPRAKKVEEWELGLR